jgi:hypothetical protein
LTGQRNYSLASLRFLRKSCENQLFNHDLTVKIVAQNKKDGKGNDLNFSTKKSLPTKIFPKIPLSGYFQRLILPLP